MTKTDVPSFCFAAGTQVQTHAGLQKIETLHVGQRVLADASDAEHSTAVRAGDWRRVEFTFADPHTEDGKLCRVVLLRPAEHVAAQGWRSGGEVEIDFGPEVQRESGDARIVSITPAAEPEHGAGQVVTGTFQTWHRDLRELWMEGLEEPVRVTSGHRFYSASREAWIDAHHLQVGETVRTRDGSGCRVLAVKPLAGEHEVFNIEVETLHQYHVTPAGLLTHNNTDCKTSASAKGTVQANTKATGELYEVGTAAELRKVSVPGTEVNHFPGTAAASSLVGDINAKNNFGNEAAIRLPISEHANVTAGQRAMGAQASAPELLAAEKTNLMENSNAPLSQINKVEKLAKDLHPFDYTDYSKKKPKNESTTSTATSI